MARPQSKVVTATRRRRPHKVDAATNNNHAEDLSFTVPEVAVVLKVSERTAYRLVSSGRLKSFAVGDLTRVSRAALDRFMANGGARIS